MTQSNHADAESLLAVVFALYVSVNVPGNAFGFVTVIVYGSHVSTADELVTITGVIQLPSIVTLGGYVLVYVEFHRVAPITVID